MHTHTHACTHTHTHTHTRTVAHTHTHTHAHTHTHTTHTHIHTRTRTHAHTHTLTQHINSLTQVSEEHKSIASKLLTEVFPSTLLDWKPSSAVVFFTMESCVRPSHKISTLRLEVNSIDLTHWWQRYVYMQIIESRTWVKSTANNW